ncbi:MAG TPA: hypothetical protein VNM16_12060, partial [Bacillota bacterium]|nr:hypothetical protein [Bacillota bacterium]
PAGWTPPEGARRLAEAAWSVDIDQAATVYGHLADSGISVDGDPTAWRRLAKTAADSREAAESLPSLPWPGPVAGDPNTLFADELPATPVPAEPPAIPVPAEPPLTPPLGPAAHRREIRRFLERAERARRLVSVVTLAGQRCSIVPTLSGQRVRGRCVDCGGDVDVAIAEIHSVGSR